MFIRKLATYRDSYFYDLLLLTIYLEFFKVYTDLIRFHLWKKEQWQNTVLTMILMLKSTQPFWCIILNLYLFVLR